MSKFVSYERSNRTTVFTKLCPSKKINKLYSLRRKNNDNRLVDQIVKNDQNGEWNAKK